MTDLSGTFANVESLVGGTGSDAVQFQTGGSVTGTINGAGGANSLDYSALSSAVTVNLATGTASFTGGITGFVNVQGGSGNDILVDDGNDNILSGIGGDDTLTVVVATAR